MIKLIGLEFVKLRKVLVLFPLLYIILIVKLVNDTVDSYSLQYNIEIWSQAYELILYLFPLFCTIPTTWLLYYERKNNFIRYSIIRTKSSKYLLSKLLAHSIYTFFITFTMSMFMLILSLYVISPVSGTANSIAVFQLDCYLNSPFLYGLILSLWRGLLSLLFVAFGFIVSLLFNNIFVIMILPFVYSLIESIVLSRLNLFRFRMETAIGVCSGGCTAGLQLWYLFIGPIILIGVTIIFFLVGYRKKIFFNR